MQQREKQDRKSPLQFEHCGNERRRIGIDCDLKLNVQSSGNVHS